jgi:hypothetical protein
VNRKSKAESLNNPIFSGSIQRRQASVNEETRDKMAYELGRQFLLALSEQGVTAALLNKYLSTPAECDQPDNLAGLYRRLLESAQNANMKAGVIGVTSLW